MSFFLRGLLSFRIDARAVVLVDLLALDLFSVDRRPHVGRMLRLLHAAARDGKDHGRKRQQDRAAQNSL